MLLVNPVFCGKCLPLMPLRNGSRYPSPPLWSLYRPRLVRFLVCQGAVLAHHPFEQAPRASLWDMRAINVLLPYILKMEQAEKEIAQKVAALSQNDKEILAMYVNRTEK